MPQSFLTHCLCAWLSYHSCILTCGRSKALQMDRLGGNLWLGIIPIVLAKKRPTHSQVSSAEMILPWVEVKWEVLIMFFPQRALDLACKPLLIDFVWEASVVCEVWWCLWGSVVFERLCDYLCHIGYLLSYSYFSRLVSSSLLSLYLNWCKTVMLEKLLCTLWNPSRPNLLDAQI